MKMFCTFFLVLALAYLAPISGLASAVAVGGHPAFYLWDNLRGFSPAAREKCELIEVTGSKFFISHYSGEEESLVENLRDSKLKENLFVLNGTLVRKTGNTLRRHYYEVEVLGQNHRQTNLEFIEKNKLNEKIASRFDKGYLYKHSLLSLAPFSFKLQDNKVENDGLFDYEVSGKYLQALYLGEESEDRIPVLRCQQGDGTRDYQVFALFNSEDSSLPELYVGLYHEETSLLRDFVTEEELFQDFEPTFDGLQRNYKKYIQTFKDLAESPAPSDIPIEEVRPAEVTTQGEFQHIICSENEINVRNEDLTKIVFKANPGELVKIFQGFEGENKKTKLIDKKKYNFVKVEFPDREAKDQKIAWVAEDFIKLIAECGTVQRADFEEAPMDEEVTGLKDQDCCNFPTVERPRESYLEGKRMFGWNRGKGSRLHAACDLYRHKNDPVVAVAPGKVTLGLYYFYQGTYAIEVTHAGGFVARYGELTSKKADGVKAGAIVIMGQRLGYIGKVNSGCCEPMLHFELYSGSKKGSLSGGGRYKRRSDLLNPTNYLQKWEMKKFGESY